MKYFFPSLLLFLCSEQSLAQLDWLEVQIPMSDGSTLAADIYLPEGWISGPAILIQTPYNKNFYHFTGLPLGIGMNQDEMEYAMVIMDWRGFWSSTDAAYSGAPTRGEDGYSCIQWIAAQTWCDGNVGTWGPSALGKVQFQTAQLQPPNLKCIVPLVAGPQFEFNEYYTGGALRTEFVEQLDGLGFGLSPIIIGNPNYNLLWGISEEINFYPEEIVVPSLMIGGWYDHNVEVMLDFFSGLQTDSPADVQDQHKLLFGPWVHGGNSTANVGSPMQGELSYPAALGYPDSLALMFFDYHLKGIDNGWETMPAVKYFQMGEDEWLDANNWPAEITTPIKFLFRADGLMSTGNYTNGPVGDALPLVYDPEDPSPTIGGPTLRSDLNQGPYDQTEEVESRNDVLIFTTNELTQDVQLHGKAKVHLQFTTDVVDTDFAIRLCDVYPDGRSMLVNDGTFRARFINGFAENDEALLTSGNVYECEIELPNCAITFLEGHRIRVIVSGSNYPRFNRNMNNGTEMYPDLNGDILIDPLVAHSEIQIGNSDNAPSYVEMPLVDYVENILEMNAGGSFQLFPNPSGGTVTIKTAGKLLQDSIVEARDECGRIIYTSVLLSAHQIIDTSSWASGIYTISILGNNMLQSQRLTKL